MDEERFVGRRVVVEALWVVEVMEVVEVEEEAVGGASSGERRGLLSLSHSAGASLLTSLVNIPKETSTPDTQSTISRETNTLDKGRRRHLPGPPSGGPYGSSGSPSEYARDPPLPTRPQGNTFLPKGPTLVFFSVITFLIPLPGTRGGMEEKEEEEEEEEEEEKEEEEEQQGATADYFILGGHSGG